MTQYRSCQTDETDLHQAILKCSVAMNLRKHMTNDSYSFPRGEEILF